MSAGTDAELAWRARTATCLSQRAFARLIGAHPSTIAEWESGRGRVARLTRSLLRLVEADPWLARTVLLGQGERCKCSSCQGAVWVRRADRSPRPGGCANPAFADPCAELLPPFHDPLPRSSPGRQGSTEPPVGREP